MIRLCVVALLVWPSLADDQTSVTQSLLSMMERGQTGYYTGGKGVVVRDITDGLQDGPNQGVPATFWSNDIFSMSQMYPDRVDLDTPGVTDIFDYASVGFIIGSAMTNLFYDFDNMQEDSWGWGVFYAHDSNSVDIRCRWIGSISMYDCPGGYILWGKTFQADSTKLGTGGYPVGNPYANPAWGGGCGCHFDYVSKTIDQISASDGTETLVQDEDCQCNYWFKNNWGDWVSTFGAAGTTSTHSLHGDQGICWVNNVRDMIVLQNWLWWSFCAGGWAPTQGLFSGSGREYMGWNEVPVNRVVVNTPANWDAFLIKLPANSCGNGGGDDSLYCLSSLAQSRLEHRIDLYKNGGSLVPGASNIGTRPGAYTVVAREWVDENSNWFRWIFCEDWTSPNSEYQVVFLPITTSNQYGACYMEYA